MVQEIFSGRNYKYSLLLLWTVIFRFKCEGATNDFWHTSHLYSFFTFSLGGSWNFLICLLRESKLLNFDWHTSHFNLGGLHWNSEKTPAHWRWGFQLFWTCLRGGQTNILRAKRGGQAKIWAAIKPKIIIVLHD